MLYGNLIFIKKTGGDGSKYPVTERNIKIGRSENCLIRIYNPQVAPEHCQLIIDSNGQAKLKNLFSPTILNGKPLGQGDVTLCHGDVFKLGERLARWEYLPTSKYFRQLLSPTGRLVAVVNPQRRPSETPETSETQMSESKSTPLGKKRKLLEKVFSEDSSLAKQRKTVGLDSPLKPKMDLGKLLIGRHSIKGGKLLLKSPMVKQRKSVSGLISSKSSKNKVGKSRKSTLPSWKVNVYEQPNEAIQSKGSSPKDAVKTPSKRSLKNEVRTPSKSTPIKAKTPRRLKLDPKVKEKSSLKTILESPQPESVRTTRSFSKSPPMKVLCTPKRKSPIQAVRLVQSEKKPKSSLGTQNSNKRYGKMSLVLKKGDRRISFSQKGDNSGRKSAKKEILKSENETEVVVSEISNLTSTVSTKDKTLKKCDTSFSSPKETREKTVKNTPVKTPRKYSKRLSQSSIKKTKEDIAQALSDVGDSKNTKLTPRESINSNHKSLQKSVTKCSANSIDFFQTPQKILKKASSSPVLEKGGKEPSRLDVVWITPKNLSSGNVTTSKKSVRLSKKKKVSPRGVRRKLSPSISSAERAAKKLKTSCPKKPDKNKRAALLVLGKANRKQLLSQSVKVLLKQKIVKKAIKQSVALPKLKDVKKKTSVTKTKKVLKEKKKNSGKINKTNKVSAPARVSQTLKEFPPLNKVTEKSINEPEKSTPHAKKISEKNLFGKLKISSPVPPTKLATPNTSSAKVPVKSSKKTESILLLKSTNQTISPFVNDKSPENYMLSSNRRSSKRLSSKNNTERPDFVELSPTALGLIPKNVEMFKTPKEKKRKSSSLVTPRNARTLGIIKSASTSKIGNRKSVSFSSKNLSMTSTAYTPNACDKTDFDFDSFHTSDITMDVFVSPLNRSSSTPVVEFGTDENMKPSARKKNTPGSKRVVRKLLQTPEKVPASNLSDYSDLTQTIMSSISDSNDQKLDVESPRVRKTAITNSSDLRGVKKLKGTPKVQKSPKNDLSDLRGIKKLLRTPKVQKSPKNDLSDLRGVKKLLGTPKVQMSPKNDLSDLRGIKKLLRTPKVQKSPKNDLSDLRGVKKLLGTPKVQMSPKNDLSDLRGVKKLLRTPKMQKSPKNDLSDLRGVKKLMATPKVQKSPKNDLSDLRGVKKLLGTPKVQMSPKNDLSDLRGVKKLMATPKVQKSPKNDLSDLRGVKKLMATPKVQKSPKNDLSDLRGVKKLLRTPKVQKSPKNDLSDLRGVKKLMATPKVQKSPKNDLSDLRGVKKLLGTPKVQMSPKNDLSDLSGVKKLMATPRVQKSPKNDLSDLRGVKKLMQTPRKQGNPKNELTNLTGVRQLLKTPKGQKSPKNNLSDVEGIGELFASPEELKDLKGAPQGLNKTSEGRKNDSFDVTGDGQVLASNKPMSECEVYSTGLAVVLGTIKAEKEKTVLEFEGKKSVGVSETKTGRGRRKKLNDEKEESEKVVTPKRRTRQGSTGVKTRITRSRKLVTAADTTKEVNKLAAASTRKTLKGEKADAVKKITRTRTQSKKETETPNVEAAKTSRKRKLVEVVETSPPKSRRKTAASKQSDSKVESVESKGVAVRSKTLKSEEKDKAKNLKKVPGKSKTPTIKASKVQTKTTKSGAKSVSKTQKVQKTRSQTGLKHQNESSKSGSCVSPRKTRSVNAKNSLQKTRTAAPGKKK